MMNLEKLNEKEGLKQENEQDSAQKHKNMGNKSYGNAK